MTPLEHGHLDARCSQSPDASLEAQCQQAAAARRESINHPNAVPDPDIGHRWPWARCPLQERHERPDGNRIDGQTPPPPHERDPNGLLPSAPGAKLDAGKARAGLVLLDFALALEAVAQVGTFGADKYTPHGWLSVPAGIERYTDALFRHLLAEATAVTGVGPLATDPDSGLAHAAHAAWNALARLQLALMAAQGRASPPTGAKQVAAAPPKGTVA